MSIPLAPIPLATMTGLRSCRNSSKTSLRSRASESLLSNNALHPLIVSWRNTSAALSFLLQNTNMDLFFRGNSDIMFIKYSIFSVSESFPVSTSGPFSSIYFKFWSISSFSLLFNLISFWCFVIIVSSVLIKSLKYWWTFAEQPLRPI